MSEADDAKSTSNRTKKPQGKNQPKKKAVSNPRAASKREKALARNSPPPQHQLSTLTRPLPCFPS